MGEMNGWIVDWWMGERVDGWIGEMAGWMVDGRDEWMDGRWRADGWMDGRAGWVDGRGEWMDGRAGGWMGGWME